jgi:hypothetical protein
MAAEPKVKRSSRYIPILFALVLILFAGWFLVRPGIFTTQPGGEVPKGETFIYYSRGTEIPFFASPDGLCLKMNGSVTLFCRQAALSGSSELAQRIIIRLPYLHWAYLRTTGGVEFDP